MINHGGRYDPSVPLAVRTQRMPCQVSGTKMLPPRRAVQPVTIGTASIVVAKHSALMILMPLAIPPTGRDGMTSKCRAEPGSAMGHYGTTPISHPHTNIPRSGQPSPHPAM